VKYNLDIQRDIEYNMVAYTSYYNPKVYKNKNTAKNHGATGSKYGISVPLP